MNTRRDRSLLVLWLALAACSSSSNSEPNLGAGADDGGREATANVAGVTFHKDVEPILQRHCQGCHVPSGIAPFALTTYGEAKSVAGLMVLRTAERAMPPGGAVQTAECTPP